MNDTAVRIDEDVARLIATHPFGWIVPHGDPALASPMPLLLLDGDTLLGHLPRAHPLVGAFTADPSGVFLFQGPHGYISPEWLSDKDWAPTWNFAIATITAEVVIDDALTDEALRRLVAHMEQGRARPWTVEAMGPRYTALRERVIGFRATITGCKLRRKLGQDESDTVFGEILAGLGDTPLAQWMAEAR
ncbi:MAG: Transcriptional regulator-like protein [Sphingomonas bacterium]|uniref:FMN-binding negative transcriptional regulator n=1 Tax=Sphingomonas bacterium TaxID=1895847 RepID=UPI002634F641|nr:FMN-binding negative transcriptional regulator [Sphingomonas bacterium]MDB5708793.1 Transcriptional regulator-like protein [Sphingomonas bacterium]